MCFGYFISLVEKPNISLALFTSQLPLPSRSTLQIELFLAKALFNYSDPAHNYYKIEFIVYPNHVNMPAGFHVYNSWLEMANNSTHHFTVSHIHRYLFISSTQEAVFPRF